MLSIDVEAKDWRGIVPLHSTRADVKRLLGTPLFEEGTPADLYDVEEGRINFMYVVKKCQQGLPSNWGNWNVALDTVVNITIYLKKPMALAELRIADIEKFKWYTDDSGATYYQDKEQGIEYQVQDNMVTGITYGPTAKDNGFLCNENAPLIRY
jgi:hypothetical protein